MKVKRALISVSDKSGLLPFVKALTEMGVEIISTGGTKKYIEESGVRVKDIAEFTGFPEILDGRVKTLHPKVHGALLAKRNNKKHIKQVEENNISYIDMVVVNLYPFEETLKNGAGHEEIIENIDIGGPSMLRSAAKNYEDVIVLCDSSDYMRIIADLKKNGDINCDERMRLAAKVFEKTNNYDRNIFNYLSDKKEMKNIQLTKALDLRYGENPHQNAGYYKEDGLQNNFKWEQLAGKELSYNNLMDIEAAWSMANDFQGPTAVIVEHNNPCGVGRANNPEKAYINALAADSLSAYGGIVAVNEKLTKKCAEEIIKIFTECVIAPDFEKDALDILKTKKNLRIISISGKIENAYEIRRALDGFLIQDKDLTVAEENKIVTNNSPTKDETEALNFAWIVCKHVKSNAIVIADKNHTIGIGAGQMSRVDSVEIAVNKAKKAGLKLEGAVLASDAFFPFRDSIETIAPYGIKAVIQPGGSVRDGEVIDACNQHNISMVFTGKRHFRH
ncbi:MAG: bifunctional phosphoribosylaminoimidazolecarboxamide formyltransferase/IMP cyclohydrolase [Elusimicrobiota bacterium]